MCDPQFALRLKSFRTCRAPSRGVRIENLLVINWTISVKMRVTSSLSVQWQTKPGLRGSGRGGNWNPKDAEEWGPLWVQWDCEWNWERSSFFTAASATLTTATVATMARGNVSCLLICKDALHRRRRLSPSRCRYQLYWPENHKALCVQCQSE